MLNIYHSPACGELLEKEERNAPQTTTINSTYPSLLELQAS